MPDPPAYRLPPQLASLGVDDVVVLEREQHAGGVPRHCGHLGFGWREFARLLTGPGYAKRLVESARNVRDPHAASPLCASSLEVLCTWRRRHGPATLKGQRVLLALGTRESPRAARLVSGSRPWGVVTTGALQQMVYLAGLRPFERAVIVGSELVSFSNLLTMRHAGIRPLALVEEGPRIIAPGPARAIARLVFGARVLTGTRVVAVHGGARVSGVEVERDGQREILECDGVVFSGRFVPESAILQSSHLALDPATGGPVVDQYGRCSDPSYFAAGQPASARRAVLERLGGGPRGSARDRSQPPSRAARRPSVSSRSARRAPCATCARSALRILRRCRPPSRSICA